MTKLTMDYKKALIGAGLSPKEVSVYLANYEIGEANIARIAQKSGVKRSTAYLEINNLAQNGLIGQTTRNNKKYYIARSPKNILTRIEDSKMALEKVMPELLALGTAFDKKSQIQYFEGIPGIKEVFRATLEYPKREILTWFSGPIFPKNDHFIENYYIPERLKRKIWNRAIRSNSKEFENYSIKDQEQLRQSKVVSSNKFNLDNEIILYGERGVAIISAEDKIGIIIESEQIHKSLCQIFEIMWEALS